MWEIIWEATKESLISLPVLFIIYFLMELLEHKQEVKFEKFVAKSKKTGPLWGSLIGCIPQCAFSAVMADLFSKRMITIGTLFAVFIATSDEAIAILLSSPNNALSVVWLIIFKIIFAIIIGFVIDLIFRKQKLKQDNLHHSNHFYHEHSHSHEHTHKEEEICKNCCSCETCKIESESCEDCEHNKLHHSHELCEHNHGMKGIFLEALKHSLIIFAWILGANIVIHCLLHYVGLEQLKTILLSGTIFEPIILCLIGLIPNCGASVAVVDLYLNGIIGFGSCIGALCAGAGLGLIILFKNNKNFKQNLLITVALYGIGVLVGFIINLIPLGI